MRDFPTDPMRQHRRMIAAFCDDILAGEYHAPRAKAVCEISRQMSGMEPREPIFRDHNCGGCDSGAKPCREGNYNSCSYPRARND